MDSSILPLLTCLFSQLQKYVLTAHALLSPAPVQRFACTTTTLGPIFLTFFYNLVKFLPFDHI